MVFALVGCVMFAGMKANWGGYATAATGPTVIVGEPSVSGGNVVLPIQTTGVGFDGYTGFNLHIRWDPAAFQFVSYDTGAGQFASATCGDVIASPDGGDIDFRGCALGTGAASIVSPGLLATLTIAPAASNCSLIHFVTETAPDSDTHGTFTFAGADLAKQVNQFVDRAVSPGALPCTPPALPTPTATPTTPPTPIPTATLTPEPTSVPDYDLDGYSDSAEVGIGKAPFVYCAIMRADVTGDGIVNAIDLSRTAQRFGAPAVLDLRENQNGDTVINAIDLMKVAQQFANRVVGCL